MVRVIYQTSSLGKTGALIPLSLWLHGILPILTSGGMVQDDPLAMDLCLCTPSYMPENCMYTAAHFVLTRHYQN